MNGIPMGMMNTLMPMLQQQQGMQPQMQPQVQQPQVQQPQQQFPDPSVAVNKVIEQFAQHLEKEKNAGRLRAEQYGEVKRGLGTQLEQAGEKYAEPYKMGTKDYAALIASIALPVIGALQKEGRGRRGLRATQRRQQMWTGLGKAAGAIGQGFQAQHGQQQEREFAGAKESIGYQSGLADMGYATQEGRAATQFGMAGKLLDYELDAGKQTALEEYRRTQQETQAARDAATAGHRTEQLGISQQGMDLHRDQFEYGKTQDARAFDTKVTDQRGETTGNYRERAAWGIQQAAAEKMEFNPEKADEIMAEMLKELKKLYGLDLDPSMEIPAGGNRGIQTPAERMGMGGRPSLIDIDEELRRRGVNVGP